jgi:hypothetical protein
MRPQERPLRMPETTTPTTVAAGPASVVMVSKVNQPSGNSVDLAGSVGHTSKIAMKKREDNPLLRFHRMARLRLIAPINERMSLHG